jgi:hypothetical protein
MHLFFLHDDSAKSIFQKALIYIIQGQWQMWDVEKTMWKLMKTLEVHGRILFGMI